MGNFKRFSVLVLIMILYLHLLRVYDKLNHKSSYLNYLNKRTKYIHSRVNELCGQIPNHKTLFFSKGCSIYDKSNHRLYCGINKGGCTSFAEFLLKTKGLKEKQQKGYRFDLILRKSFDLFPAQNMSMNLNVSMKSYKILFSRNPYERMISGYLDRIKNQKGIKPSLDILCATLHKKTKMKICEQKSSDVNVSFSDFIQLIINVYQRNGAAAIERHFGPQYILCNPCYYDYDYQIKVETMAQDIQFMISTHFFPNISFPHKNRSPKIKDRLYFETLSQTQYENFIEIYKLDFLLLDYPIIAYKDL